MKTNPLFESLQKFGIEYFCLNTTLVMMSESNDSPSKSKNPEHYSFLDRDALAKYTTDTGKILPRKYTGLTPMQQRKVSRLIKKARHMQILK